MVRRTAALLVFFAAGCASHVPDAPVPQPKPVASQPAPPQPVARAAAPPVVKSPASKPAVAPVAARPAVVATPAARVPVVAATLDLDALKARLRATKAIGVFTKIALKNKVDDLMKQFRGHYDGKASPTMAQLRQSYDLLMMKVLSLLQDSDRTLASAIVSSREAIWSLLADQKKFDALQS
jgi:pyruvate/2-oxoglutarate dehydrogenase complex dihydrolipoamide acyltransferase (E2) component